MTALDQPSAPVAPADNNRVLRSAALAIATSSRTWGDFVRPAADGQSLRDELGAVLRHYDVDAIAVDDPRLREQLARSSKGLFDFPRGGPGHAASRRARVSAMVESIRRW